MNINFKIPFCRKPFLSLYVANFKSNLILYPPECASFYSGSHFFNSLAMGNEYKHFSVTF